MKNVELVIFDMDGLMFDTESMYLNFAPDVCESLGFPVTREILKKTIGTNHQWAQEILKAEGYENFPFAELWKILDKKYDEYYNENGVPIKNGLFELLEHLKGKSMKMAVATSSRRVKAEYLLKISGVDKYFDSIMCGDEIINGKPDPEIFLKTADVFGVKYENCVVLEDSINGIKAAKSANMIPVMIPDMIEPTEEISEMIYKKANNLEEIIKILI